MPISRETTDRRFKAGEFAALASEAKTIRHRIEEVEASVRLVIAHALALSGSADEANAWATSPGLSATDLANRSRLEVVRGLIDELNGELNRAFERYQGAVRLAGDSKDAEVRTWAYLHLFRNAIEGCPLDVVAAMLPEVRKAVTRLGQVQATAFLHESVAVLEGQTGRLDEAARHCAIADSLLERVPNAWLEASGLVNRACIASLNCEFEQAHELLRQAQPFVSKSGLARAAAVIDSNLGHVELMTGQFDQARLSFQRAIDSPGSSVFARMGATDGMARLHLALGEFDKCQALLAGLEDNSRVQTATRSIYHVRWAGITRARLLSRRGDPEAALKSLSTASERSERVRDQVFAGAAHLVAAEILTSFNRPQEAIARLVAADQEGVTANRELQAQYYAVAAAMVADTSILLSDMLRARASRIWRRQGMVSLPLEMGTSASKGDESLVDRPLESPSPFSLAASVANLLGSVFDLAHSPTLVGTELVDALRLLGCEGARLRELRKTDGVAISQSTRNSFILSDLPSKRTILECSVPIEPAKAVVLADVLRIGRAALELERARKEERSRAALWPASPVEERAGALFIAEEMQTILSTVRRIAPTNIPVLITGETGTGKEVLARMIHAYSNRSEKTLLPFNCSATPKDMLDSQLFGHRRGAFTGANEHFAGVIRAAAGSTLFLDEIGEMTLDVQPKLLRFLESHEVHPIGEIQPVSVDVRVIVATNADLESLLAQGRLREDLFYRLNIVRLHVPPLRDRRVEIPSLANHYLEKYARENDRGDLRLAEETMEYLVLYRWPGNVRQLANEMRRLVALAEPGAVLMPEHLSPEIAASRRTIPASERILESTELVVRIDQPMPAAVQHLERAMIQYGLKKCHGRMEETAALLGLSRKGLYLKRQRLGLDQAHT